MGGEGGREGGRGGRGGRERQRGWATPSCRRDASPRRVRGSVRLVDREGYVLELDTEGEGRKRGRGLGGVRGETRSPEHAGCLYLSTRLADVQGG